MKKVGRLYQEENYIIIDALPFVMSKVRNLFSKSSRWHRGVYTHKTVALSNTMFNYRDIDWIMSRYHLECEPELLKKIKEKSAEYEKLHEDLANSSNDFKLKTSKEAWKFKGIKLRPHQISFQNMAKKVKKMLLADKMGLGKTISALSLLVEPDRRPALIVLPPTLCTQWESVIKEILPQAKTHIIRGFKNYELPEDTEILITSYNRLAPWEDILNPIKFKTIIFDEIHELRHTGTGKRQAAKSLSENCEMVIGLSGTPIFNYGSEIWSVLDVISSNCLGSRDDFISEWCDSWSKTVLEPNTLNSFLNNMGLMLRREPEDVGLDFGKLSKNVYTIDADLNKLKEIQDIAKTLALSVLSGKVGLDSDASREFDWKLRHATGVAKAKPVSEFVKMILEEEEKVVLTGWHRDFYDIILKELKAYSPVMFTGSESVKQKEESIKKFIEGDSRICIISLRSGAGLDGLQKVCNVIVHGELDWSPHIHDQLNTRLKRDGQKKHVQAHYLTVADGSDPFIIETLNIKRSQHDGLIEGKTAEAAILETPVDKDRIKKMAKNYLESIGEEIPDAIEETGLLKEVAELVRKVSVVQNDEEEMQEGLFEVLKKELKNVEIKRELKISKRSRLDFLISNKNEKVILECKINSKKRADVYRQVRRYIEEIENPSAVVLLAPWHGISSFIIDEVPVVIVDSAINAL